MVDIGEGEKIEAEIVVYVGCQSLCPHMTIVALIHALHRIFLRLQCRGRNAKKDGCVYDYRSHGQHA